MTDTIVLGGLTVRIPDIDDFSYEALLPELFDEHQRLQASAVMPHGIFQHVAVLQLEPEFLSIIDEHTPPTGSKQTTSDASPWSRHQCAKAEVIYITYIDIICAELVQESNKAKKHTAKLQRRTKANLTDLTIARMLVLLLDAVDNLETYLLENMHDKTSS